jgi:hypothetical protein
VKERDQSGLISIEHICTASMLADPLTKGLIHKQFHEYIVRILGYAYGINFKNFTSNNQGSIVI